MRRLAVIALLGASTMLVATEADAAPHRSVLVALGDSVAAGHGLDLADFAGGDDCWKAGKKAYARRFFDTWRMTAPAAARDGYEFALLACSGATTADVLASQIDGAVALDPEIVTLTVGANDFEFTHPERLFVDGRVRWTAVAARLSKVNRGLYPVLRRLVRETDATILVTTYHNPAGDDPYGVPGCRGRCFAAASERVVEALNGTIASVASAFPAGRVRVVDVAPAFVGHGAPNGWGIDAVRADNLPSWVPKPSFLAGVIDGTEAVQPFCARGHTLGFDENWVSGVDCIHLNDDGAAAYAAALWQAWEA